MKFLHLNAAGFQTTLDRIGSALRRALVSLFHTRRSAPTRADLRDLGRVPRLLRFPSPGFPGCVPNWPPHTLFKRSEVSYFNGRFVVDAFVLLVLFKVIHKMSPLSTFTTKTTCLSGLNVVLGLLLVHFWFKKKHTMMSLNKNISPQSWGGKHVSENRVSLIYVLSSLWSPFYFTLLCFFK